MKKLNKITFNHVAKEIIITKAFEVEANSIGSPAYDELVRIRKDFPDYTIKRKEIAKRENKKSFKGLTIDEMKRFLATVGEEDVKLFEKVCAIAESKQGKYRHKSQIRKELFKTGPPADLIAEKYQQHENAGEKTNVVVGKNGQEQS